MTGINLINKVNIFQGKQNNWVILSSIIDS